MTSLPRPRPGEIPKQAERREFDLRDLMRKGKRPVV